MWYIAPKWLMPNHGCEALYVKCDKERKENKNLFWIEIWLYLLKP